ncbi:HD-GYP domain-containing protein [Helicovermis profundi]|uniref:HD-GYP domain-containing protein n=1 Tax=Helicovermis profundi TaxID=3065157 RepID=A0AAU9E4H3_9FIRM|nr:HD-GYP domain-containing protein [Clostridia bacterium S502]
MRAVPTKFIKGSPILGETLYNARGQILVKSGATLTDILVEKINSNRIFTVYLKDEHSNKDINRVIEQTLRLQGINLIKDLFAKAINNEASLLTIHNQLSEYAEDVLYETSSVKEKQIEYIDIKNVDDYLYSSSLNTAILSMLIAWELKISRDMVKQIFLGGIYHDIGLAFLPNEITNKSKELTMDEKRMILMHPLEGYKFLKDKTYINAYIKAITLQHHEHLDGSGYPHRVDSSKINRYAYIIGIAYIYDAMTSDRPYRKAGSPKEAIEYIIGTSGTHFPKDIASTFLDKIDPYPRGSLVKLNDGRIAVVDQVPKGFSLRPSIRIISKINEKFVYTPINLLEHNSIIIESEVYNFE